MEPNTLKNDIKFDEMKEAGAEEALENKKEIKQEIERVDVYCFDERFYQVTLPDGTKRFQPSMTYMLSQVNPTGYGLMKWVGDVGNETAYQIKTQAGEDGSFIHEAIEKILNGEKILGEYINQHFRSNRALKIKKCLKSFLDWYEEYKPETISIERTVWNDELGFAGTLDYTCIIDGRLYTIDWKSSKSISDGHRIQVVGYNYADNKGRGIPAILHLGNTTKKGYSFLEIKNKEEYLEELKLLTLLFKKKFPNASPKNHVFPVEFKVAKIKKLNQSEIKKYYEL